MEMDGAVKESAEEKKQREDWEAEEDLRTLQRAKEIMADKGRMARAKAKAQRVMNVFDNL